MSEDRYDRRLVLEEHDEHGCLEIVEDSQFRALHFGTTAIQSSMEFADPTRLTFVYHQVMAMSTLFTQQPKDVLILGLGGGSLPKFFLQQFPDCQVHVVELRPRVVELAREYFEVPGDDKRLHIHVEDAIDYLTRDPRCYDIIIVDIYGDDAPADSVSQEAFFDSCQRSLREGGVLAWHLWSRTPMPVVKRCISLLTQAFGGNLFVFPVPEEWLYTLLVFRDPVTDERLAQAKLRAGSLTESSSNDFSGLWERMQQYMQRS